MTVAARGFSTNKPLRIDQMKKNNPMIESKKAPSKLSIALSIYELPFNLCTEVVHGSVNAYLHATQQFVAIKISRRSKPHFLVD